MPYPPRRARRGRARAAVPPLHKLTVPELARRGLPDVHDQAVPGEPFETCWVYELPREVRGLRLLLPFDGLEFVIPERSSA